MIQRKCIQCKSAGIDTPATIQAYWVDVEGKVHDDKIVWVCDDCLEAGNPQGPGYILAKAGKEE